MRLNLQSGGFGWQRVQRDAIHRIVSSAKPPWNLPGLKVLHRSTQFRSSGIVERDIKMGLNRIINTQSLEHIAANDQRSVLSFEPYFINQNGRRMSPSELDVSDIRR